MAVQAAKKLHPSIQTSPKVFSPGGLMKRVRFTSVLPGGLRQVDGMPHACAMGTPGTNQ